MALEATSANVTLILEGENYFAGGQDKAGIVVGTGRTLTIEGTGSVTAVGGTGIGGDGGSGRACGTIIINSGTVTAIGGTGGDGIGCGANNTSQGSFSTGEDGNAVIFASSIGDRSNEGAWSGIIFAGDEGKVYGNQTLTADLTIPEGKTLTIEDGQTLTIPKNVTLTNKSTLTNNGTLTNHGTITNGGTIIGTVGGNPPVQPAGTRYLGADGNSLICVDSANITANDAAWSGGWYVVNETVTIGNAVTVSGDVHLILADDCTLTVTGGIQGDGNLAIYAQSTGTAMGKLTATGGAAANVSFGILTAYYQESSDTTTVTAPLITISGGNVSATGGAVTAENGESYGLFSVICKYVIEDHRRVVIGNVECRIAVSGGSLIAKTLSSAGTHAAVNIKSKDNLTLPDSLYWRTSAESAFSTDEFTFNDKAPYAYLEIVDHSTHRLTKTEARAATCTEAGNAEYWTCSVRNKLFSDENGTTETFAEKVKIDATNEHTPGEWASNSTQHWKVCTVCGAEFDKADHAFSGNTCTECGYTKPSTDGSSSITTKTEVNPDGSVTTTVTNKITGTVTETTRTPDGTTGTVVTDKNGEITEVKSSVSSTAATEAAKTGGAVTLPVEVPAVKTTGDAPAVEISVPQSAGSVKVEIPVETVTPGTVAVIVKADGSEKIVKTSLPTVTGVALTLDGSATVKIVDNAKAFVDIHPVNHWAADAVDFTSAGASPTAPPSPPSPPTRPAPAPRSSHSSGAPPAVLSRRSRAAFPMSRPTPTTPRQWPGLWRTALPTAPATACSAPTPSAPAPRA